MEISSGKFRAYRPCNPAVPTITIPLFLEDNQLFYELLVLTANVISKFFVALLTNSLR
jgi:hypothetical protein